MLARLASWCLGIVIGFDDLTPLPPTVEVEGVSYIPSAPVRGKRGSKEVAKANVSAMISLLKPNGGRGLAPRPLMGRVLISVSAH